MSLIEWPINLELQGENEYGTHCEVLAEGETAEVFLGVSVRM